VLSAALALPMAGAAQPPADDTAVLQPLLDAAKAKGLNVVIIGPQQAAPVVPLETGGNSLAELGGRVTKRVQAIIAAAREPGWPQPSSDPTKPLLNGILTVFGIFAGLLIAQRAGLEYRASEGPGGPRPSPPVDRPLRVARAAAGVAIAAVTAMVLPFAVYGPGSKTIELVGAITEVFLRCAAVLLIAAPLLDRAKERVGGAVPGFNPGRVARHLRAALTAVFLFAAAALTLTFMYPDPALDSLARVGYVTLIAGLAISLAHMHRADLGVLASTALGGHLRAMAGPAWAVLAGYFAAAWAIACVRILLRVPEAGEVVLAPATALLGGIAAYHIALWLFSLLLRRDVAPAPGVDAAPSSHSLRQSWPVRIAKAIGVAAGLLLAFERLGFPMWSEDGSLAAVPATAVVLLLAYGAWVYGSEAIDRRLALEAPEPGQDGEGEGGGQGRSRLATLLPIFRNALQGIVVFVAALMLLHKAGINTTPIFASAGIVGLAIGFGAQSLVKDIISGLFYLLDDAFRVGEYIETGGLKGTVERISIRSMQLRHQNGPLNTIAFGSIAQLTNYSRDWVIMKLPIVLTLDTDVERVRKLVKKLGQELLEDPVVGHKFLDPLKSQGVLKIDNWGITIRVKFKTRPGDQFAARRVVYARLHELFEREGIEFASRDVKIKIDASEDEIAKADERTLAAVAKSIDEGTPQDAAAGARR
jgi:small-conductance mechanosensitive channel